MTKSEIVEYVMHSPDNTNPAVLGSMLDGLPSGSSEVYDIGASFDTTTYTFTVEKTYNEILAAYNAGKRIVYSIPVQEELSIYCDVIYYDGGFGIVGPVTSLSQNKIYIAFKTISASGIEGDTTRYDQAK